MKRTIIILAILSINLAVWADSYKILAIVGSKTVNIGGKELAEGADFSDRDVVEWVSDRQIVKVCALDGIYRGRTVKISKRAFAERGAKTMYRYVNMIGRGVDDEVPIVILGVNETDTLPINVNPTFNYQMWFDTNIVELKPVKGRIVVRSSMFSKYGGFKDVWVVSINKNDGDMTPYFHCKVDLAFGDSSVTSSNYNSESRIAMVIGNANYMDPQYRLNTPISDARAVASRLEEFGFNVIRTYDRNYESMVNAINMFSMLSAGYDVALFYYSGHGAQERRLSGDIENYMVPVNVSVTGKDDVVGRCVSLGSVSGGFGQENTRCNVRMLFVDACRSIPSLKKSSRSGIVAADYPECWAFFSTATGMKSDDGNDEHSPFTQAFLEATKTDGISLGTLFPVISLRVKELTNGEQKASLTCNSSKDWHFSNKGQHKQKDVVIENKEPGIDAYRQATTMFANEKYDEAVRLYLIAAKDGNHQAQGALGYCYYYGRGVEVNYKEAVRWYYEAASHGISYAQNGLGMCYMKGNGVEQDYEEAVRWFREAASQGDEYAQYFMGICCSLGLGTEKNYEKSVTWFTKSASQGNPDAQEALASCYLSGMGVKKNTETAKELYIKAARGGNEMARVRLNEMGVPWR